MLVRVDGPMTVRFRPAPATALVVIAVDPDGLLQRLGFRAGDRIVSAGGFPLAASGTLEDLLRKTKLSGGPSLNVGVDRGGETTTLEVDARLLDPGRPDFLLGGVVEVALR
jgi:S1-C subfamily serine protease